VGDRGATGDVEALRQSIRARHPGLREALLADARIAAMYRGERHRFRSRGDAIAQALRLMWVSDAFLAQALYRVKARLQALRVPILPQLAHRLAMIIAQVSIGDPVLVHPGVHIVHGQVVLDGFVEVHSGTVIAPWVTVGLRPGSVIGPTIGPGVRIGTGAKLIGPVEVGARARIGANAVVVDDVESDTTVVGIPARTVESR
jgi:serine O-acetyltransferase